MRTASTLPMTSGLGLSAHEARIVNAARNDAMHRAARLVGDNADPFPFQCGDVASEVALRVVLARRPRAAAPALPVFGTTLEVAARRLLAGLGYPPAVAHVALSWVAERGSILNIPVIDSDDLPALDAVVSRHLEGRGLVAVESPAEVDPWDREYESAEDWPADTDDDRWVPTEVETAPEVPAAEDAAWWAAESARLDGAGLGVLPIRGGAPVVPSYVVALEGGRWVVRREGRPVYHSTDEADARDEMLRRSSRDWVSPDERPVKVRSRHEIGQPDISDEDVINATGCCG